MSSSSTIKDILSRWPNRQAIADDVGKDVIVVHRWFQRNSTPGRYDAALLAGAKRRKIKLTAEEIASARSHDLGLSSNATEAAE